MFAHVQDERTGYHQDERLDENGNPSMLQSAFPIMDPQLRPLSIYRYRYPPIIQK
jgi:hypothetical protein